MWWWNLNRQQKLRRMAISLWSTPLIMLFPLWLGYFYEPSLIWEHSDAFVLFFVLPFGGAAILYWLAARTKPE